VNVSVVKAARATVRGHRNLIPQPQVLFSRP
jgi:hypothetical protein